MRILRLAGAGTALLILGGCADGRTTRDPISPVLSAQRQSSEGPVSTARRVDTSGEFDAIVDFTKLTLTPRGRNCLLRVDGALVFTGTIEGAATGQTTALVFASCAEVIAAPPGTFPDVFKSELAFEGTVDGQPACANVLYMGRVQPGGRIEGRLVFSDGVQGRLQVDAVVAVGGDYVGSVVVTSSEPCPEVTPA
jgi:hypothetical protein